MKRAVVTGCSRGIGRAGAEMLLANGWHVEGLSRTDPGIVHPEFDWWMEDLGSHLNPGMAYTDPLDALVHCAGVRGPYGSFLDTDEEAWEQTITTNLIGTARIVRACLPSLQESEDGRILLFSGGGAFSPEPGYTAYAATKGATVALMETLAEELDGTSVTVNAVAPGFVPTTIHDGTPHADRPSDGTELGTVVECVRHLLGPAAKGINGRTISAQHDDWRSITPWTAPIVQESRMGRRDRHKIEMLQAKLVAQSEYRRAI